jgi:hypothetical protein
MPKMIYTIIAYTLLALPWSSVVSDPALLCKECVKYLGCLVGSVISEAVIGSGVVVRESYSSSK